MKLSLRMNGAQHRALRAHLFPGDGCEAVALLVCGRRAGTDRHIFTTRKVVPVPHSQCSVRTPDRVVWSTEVLDELIGDIWRSGDSLIKVHSHPGWYAQFSTIDDESDRALSLAWDGLFEEGLLHGSAVMLPDGSLFGRGLVGGEIGQDFHSVMVAGDDIHFWCREEGETPEAQRRHEQAFGAGTVRQFRSLCVGVVGCSGTGSVTTELVARLGVGELVPVDPDVVEEKNLNRILNSTLEDAKAGTPKVELVARMVEALGQGQRVIPIQANLDTPEAVRRIAECDVVFGCVDTAEGRNLLNRIASYYLIPYIDVGVSLVADGKGGVDTVAGAVHYFAPGGTSLLERGAYTTEQVRAESMKRTDPERYAELRKSKYIQNVQEDRPAVVSVNMLFASLAVNEFLARIHGFRNEPNGEFSTVRGDLCEGVLFKEREPEGYGHLVKELGRGDTVPLLDRPSLSEEC